MQQSIADLRYNITNGLRFFIERYDSIDLFLWLFDASIKLKNTLLLIKKRGFPQYGPLGLDLHKFRTPNTTCSQNLFSYPPQDCVYIVQNRSLAYFES